MPGCKRHGLHSCGAFKCTGSGASSSHLGFKPVAGGTPDDKGKLAPMRTAVRSQEGCCSCARHPARAQGFSHLSLAGSESWQLVPATRMPGHTDASVAGSIQQPIAAMKMLRHAAQRPESKVGDHDTVCCTEQPTEAASVSPVQGMLTWRPCQQQRQAAGLRQSCCPAQGRQLPVSPWQPPLPAAALSGRRAPQAGSSLRMGSALRVRCRSAAAQCHQAMQQAAASDVASCRCAAAFRLAHSCVRSSVRRACLFALLSAPGLDSSVPDSAPGTGAMPASRHSPAHVKSLSKTGREVPLHTNVISVAVHGQQGFGLAAMSADKSCKLSCAWQSGLHMSVQARRLTSKQAEEEGLQAPLYQVRKHVLPGQQALLAALVAAHGCDCASHARTQHRACLPCHLDASHLLQLRSGSWSSLFELSSLLGQPAAPYHQASYAALEWPCTLPGKTIAGQRSDLLARAIAGTAARRSSAPSI